MYYSRASVDKIGIVEGGFLENGKAENFVRHRLPKLFLIAAILGLAWGVPEFHENLIKRIYVLGMCILILLGDNIWTIYKAVLRKLEEWLHRNE